MGHEEERDELPVTARHSTLPTSVGRIGIGRANRSDLVNIVEVPVHLGAGGSVGVSLATLAELALESPRGSVLWLRRNRSPDKNGSEDEKQTEVKLAGGQVVLDLKREALVVEGRVHELQIIDFQVLQYLTENKGTIVAREDVVNYVWGGPLRSKRVVDTYVMRLRKVLGEYSWILKTKQGRGYVLEDQNTPQNPEEE